MTSTADPLPTAVFTAAGQPPTGAYQGGPLPLPVPGPGASRRDRLAWRLYRLHQRSPRWAGPAAAGLCIAGAIGYTFVTHPTAAGADSFPTCLAKITTGFDCPGCGGTRAAWYLLHGDLTDAARHHAVFVFAVPFLLYMYVAWSLKTSFGWKVPQLNLSPKTISVFLAVWAVWSVLRNLPWAPFTVFYV